VTTWDLLVVGGGSAGLVGAKTAASLGARVLLVERARTGGDCLWTGCVPSKALLAAAGAAAGARGAARFGVRTGTVEVDFPAVMRSVHAAMAAIEPADSPDALRRAGVVVQAGAVVLTGPDTAEVDGRPLRFRAALLATGGEPVLPPIPGLADAEPLTSEDVWDLPQLPGRLAVLGAGPIGCELGQAFARLGAEVTVLDATDRVLSREDPAAAAVVARSMERDGVRLRLGAGVTAVRPGTDGAGELVLADGGTVAFDRLLVAVGRRPRTAGLGCAAAGVRLADDGTVVVDEALATSNPRIWAAGDVTGSPLFTHTAGVRASTAATNAVLGLRRRIDPVVPRVTYTFPEVASVGASSAEPPAGHTVQRWPHREADRAVADQDTDGFTALVLDRRGRLTGATVVGPRAGESLGELTLAVRKGLTAADIAGTTHAYPTYNDAVWNPAVAEVQRRLRRPLPRAGVRVLRALQHARLRRR
jgi:pyruvate/2-oxoglutarate dehydrogenase complex dihydrolipoamide dehydrogenase (E3) component